AAKKTVSKKKKAASPKAENPPILARADSSAPFNPNDLSDFDDIDERDESQRPGPEFRSRLDPVDNNELGEMLEGMGLGDEDESPANNLAELLEGEDGETSLDLDVPNSDANPVGRPSLLGNVAKRFKGSQPAPLPEESTLGEEELFGDSTGGAPEESLEFDEQGEPVAELGAFDEDDLDEDELEELNYVPPYSLADKLVSEDAMVAAGSRDAPYQVEILTLKDDSVSDVALLRPGQSYWVGPKFTGLRKPKDLPPRFRLAKFKRNGATVIEVPKDVQGALNRSGSDVPLAKVTDQPNRSQLKKGVVGLEMKPGEVLDIQSGASRYHVRYARPPERITDTRSAKDKFMPGTVTAYSGAGSFGAHIMAFIVVWILGY
ncbi:MAG: hypothetical protein AAF658_21515, partial [Myxococcota bacterium]